MANPPQGRLRQKQESADTTKQMKRSMDGAEISRSVRTDDTTSAEKRPCFAQSAERHILDKQPGFSSVRPTMEDHQGNRGLDTLSSDTRKAPLPEQGVKIDIDTCMPRNNENQIVGKETARENVVTP